MTPDQLLKKYPFIVATHSTSNEFYILNLCTKAHEQNQPETVTYIKNGDEWAHIREYKNENLIKRFAKICDNNGMNHELNSIVLKFDLFFENALTLSANNFKLYTTITEMVSKIIKEHEYGSNEFYSSFYLNLTSDIDFITFDELTKKSTDWKY